MAQEGDSSPARIFLQVQSYLLLFCGCLVTATLQQALLMLRVLMFSPCVYSVALENGCTMAFLMRVSQRGVLCTHGCFYTVTGSLL